MTAPSDQIYSVPGDAIRYVLQVYPEIRMATADTHFVQVLPLGPLTFVYYDEPACPGIAAHCLELDIGAQGSTKEEATKDLQDSIETYVHHLLEHGESIQVRQAPAELQKVQDRDQFHLLLVRVRVAKSERRDEIVFTRPPQSFEPSELALA